jgi:hypothetical protein
MSTTMRALNKQLRELRLPCHIRPHHDDIITTKSQSSADDAVSEDLLSPKDERRCSSLISKFLKSCFGQKHERLSLEGNTKECTHHIDKWIEGTALQGNNHLALVPVFTNVKARSSMTPSKTWVNKALFNILHVLLEPKTRKVISQTSLNTNDGIKLWEVIKTYALGDTETNRALAIERFQQVEIAHACISYRLYGAIT